MYHDWAHHVIASEVGLYSLSGSMAALVSTPLLSGTSAALGNAKTRLHIIAGMTAVTASRMTVVRYGMHPSSWIFVTLHCAARSIRNCWVQLPALGSLREGRTWECGRDSLGGSVTE